MKRISIIIPCLNEQEVIPVYYREMEKIMEQMRDIEFELIFVDDGSSDHTLDLFHKLWEKDKRCRYLSFSRNFGKEAALYAGLRHARGDYVAVMDVDLQDPPGLLIQMYEELERGGYDCVATQRVDRKGEKRVRSFLSAMFYKVANRISKVQLAEGARDFRMMNRKSPYGLGLTAMAVIVVCAWSCAGKGRERNISALLATGFVLPVFPWLLNGGLYARSKVFFPFLPLISFLGARFFEQLASW